MPTSDVISISISVSAAGPSRESFGTPLIAAYHTRWTDRVREYSSLAGMIADGFTTTDPAYLAASMVFAQNPSVSSLKIGRRALAPTQITKLTCTSTSATDTYKFSLRAAGGSWTDFAVASTGVAATDVATINTAVTAASIAGLTATHATSILTLTMTAGALLDIKFTSPAILTFHETTVDPGIATDLAAILGADSNWYGLLLDNQSPAEVTAAAAWAESNKKLFIWNSSESGGVDPASTTDIFYTEKQLAHQQSAGLYTGSTLLCYGAAGWMGRLFPDDAGTENWAFKTISGLAADALSDTAVHAIENKNATVYTTLKGLNLTQFGKLPSGGWIDTTRGVAALQDDMVTGVVGIQANNKKIPFTDAGIDQYRNVLTASLARFVSIGFLAASPAPVVSLPKANSVDPTQRAARNLPLVSFSAQLAGAINSTSVQGVLTS